MTIFRLQKFYCEWWWSFLGNFFTYKLSGFQKKTSKDLKLYFHNFIKKTTNVFQLKPTLKHGTDEHFCISCFSNLSTEELFKLLIQRGIIYSTILPGSFIINLWTVLYLDVKRSEVWRTSPGVVNCNLCLIVLKFNQRKTTIQRINSLVFCQNSL